MKLPPIKMFDVEKILLAVSPVAADGTVDETVSVEWSSSNPEAVQIEVIPDTNGRQVWALTPLDSGSSNISVTAKGYDTDEVMIEYLPFVPGKLNMSAGTPVSDIE